MGCHCEKWSGPSYVSVKTLSLAEAAAQSGRPLAFLKQHAAVLGGEHVPNTKLGKSGSGETLRFWIKGFNAALVRLDRKLLRDANKK